MNYPSPSLAKLGDLERLAASVIESRDSKRIAMAADLIARRVRYLEQGGGDDLDDTVRLLQVVRAVWRETA